MADLLSSLGYLLAELIRAATPRISILRQKRGGSRERPSLRHHQPETRVHNTADTGRQSDQHKDQAADHGIEAEVFRQTAADAGNNHLGAAAHKSWFTNYVPL